MIAVMLTPTTMSAFSSGVSQAGSGQVSAVQRVRSVANQQTPPTTALAAPQSVPAAGGLPPGQKLPRGSLLDLSV
jgi:hypothetical protein